MVARTTAKLTGHRNQCPTCGELFTRLSVFDKHRTGKFGVNRRCLTRAEMEAEGMFRGPDNFWRGNKREGFSGPPDAA